MSKKQKTSSLLAKYSALYERNPRSRVFAPLAEAHRKLGMVDEAFKILREGIKRHPSYVMGYVVLGHCYFDQQQYELAYNAVRPFVSENLENISLQKLFAQICINLGYLEEALQTFKYLLLINPKDEYVAEQVKLLEDDLIAETITGTPGVGDEGFSEDEDEWVQVDFNKRKDYSEPDESEAWSMEGPEAKLNSFINDVQKEKLEVQERFLDDDYYFEDYDNSESEKEPEDAERGESEPIITHTLVDLYIRQGHTGKAIELLESIIDLHPEDQASQRKLESLKNKDQKALSLEVGEEKAPDLANLVEEKVKSGKEKAKRELENKLNIFLQKLKNESKRRLEAQ